MASKVRELETRDVWDVAEIIQQLDLDVKRDQVKGIESWQDLGMIVFKVFLKNMPKVRQQTNTWLGGMLEPAMSAEQFEKQKLTEGMFYIFKEIAKQDGLKDFFESVGQLMEVQGGSTGSTKTTDIPKIQSEFPSESLIN